ncbi:MAG: cytochrome c biogenesis heme-transporting ATPase CcmA [Betaproteobacteria bacterium]|nr:cytochrome c biogenesis heme-transporting ATPase CcmA [Betaproteobacteria bacterium]
MLEAIDLECVRGERTLFSGLNFALRGGELMRVAGANGSGKTSLLRIVCGLLFPEQGSVRWRGENVRTLREEYGKELVYVGHSNAVKDDLTAAENVTVSCTLSGMEPDRDRVHEALHGIGLAGCEGLPARALSQGQRRRVALARLLLCGHAPLWVLDEPFAALDAQAIERVQALISAHVARGAAVVYTSHQEARLPATHTINLAGAASDR